MSFYQGIKSVKNTHYIILNVLKQNLNLFKKKFIDIKPCEDLLKLVHGFLANYIDLQKEDNKVIDKFYDCLIKYFEFRTNEIANNLDNDLYIIIVYAIKGLFLDREIQKINNIFPNVSKDNASNSLCKKITAIYAKHYNNGVSIYSHTNSHLAYILHAIKKLAQAPFVSKTFFYLSMSEILDQFFFGRDDQSSHEIYTARINAITLDNDQTKLLVKILVELYLFANAQNDQLNTEVIDRLSTKCPLLKEELRNTRKSSSKKRKYSLFSEDASESKRDESHYKTIVAKANDLKKLLEEGRQHLSEEQSNKVSTIIDELKDSLLPAKKQKLT